MIKKISVGFTAVVIILLFCFCFMQYKQNKKMAYVELGKIYNDFPMKKELEAKLKNVQQVRKSIIDSLKIALNSASLEIKSEKDIEAIQRFQIKKNEYLSKQQSFDRDNQATTQSYSEQIWKQINQYVKDYGVENNYSLIYGADGSGNLLYADDRLDITNDVSKYINERYNGKK